MVPLIPGLLIVAAVVYIWVGALIATVIISTPKERYLPGVTFGGMFALAVVSLLIWPYVLWLHHVGEFDD